MKKIIVCIIILLGGSYIMFFGFGKPLVVNINKNLPFELQPPLQEVLYYASLAPNSHNTQMWHVTAYPNQSKFVITLDTARLLLQADPDAREAYISVGAFLKNMETAFHAYGYTTTIHIPSETTLTSAAAEISFSGGSEYKSASNLLEAIETRHTDKRNYSIDAITDDTVRTLLETDTSAFHYYSNTSSLFSYLADGTADAMKLQSENHAKRSELAEWLRFSNREALEKQDGLPAEQLGMRGIKKTAYYLFTNKEIATKDQYANQGVKLTREQTKHCAGFFVLTSPNTASDWIRLGMLLEEFWLNAVSLDVSLHPMSQMLEEEPYRTEIQAKLGTDMPVQLILRAGYTENYGKNNKIRRNLADFVTLGE